MKFAVHVMMYNSVVLKCFHYRILLEVDIETIQYK